MIIAKGWRLHLHTRDDATLTPPGAILHDESGASWPACSALILPLTRIGGEVLDEVPSNVRRYFGDDYIVRGKAIDLPPLSLRAGWKRVAEIDRIDYDRLGEHEDEYTHPFSRRLPLVWRERWPILYRRGPAMRLELQWGCVWNWRGIVSP